MEAGALFATRRPAPRRGRALPGHRRARRAAGAWDGGACATRRNAPIGIAAIVVLGFLALLGAATCRRASRAHTGTGSCSDQANGHPDQTPSCGAPLSWNRKRRLPPSPGVAQGPMPHEHPPCQQPDTRQHTVAHGWLWLVASDSHPRRRREVRERGGVVQGPAAAWWVDSFSCKRSKLEEREGGVRVHASHKPSLHSPDTPQGCSQVGVRGRAPRQQWRGCARWRWQWRAPAPTRRGRIQLLTRESD